MPIPPDELLVLSRYAVIVDVEPQWSFVGHSVLGRRRLYDAATVAFLRLFATPTTPAQALAAAHVGGILPTLPDGTLDVDESVLAFVDRLVRSDLLVAADMDEPRAISDRIREIYLRDVAKEIAYGEIEDRFAPLPRSSLTAQPTAPLEPVSFLLLGWCLTQAVRPVLVERGRVRGLDAQVHVGFHDDLGLIDRLAPDVTVLQLSHRLNLTLLDQMHRWSEAEAESQLEAIARRISESIEDAAARTRGRLLLVQGIASPQTSPFGARDHRRAIGYFEAVALLNRAARRAVASHAHALFVDEEALFARAGKARLLDDLVAPYSHHGALRSQVYGLLAEAWLDQVDLWRGRGSIRLVMVDLDDTLWPGEIGSDEFSFDDERLTVPLMYGRHGGLHQALGILRDRGLLLAVVSKNSRSVVLEKWRPEQVPLAFAAGRDHTRHYLTPDDFVALEIDWRPKGELVGELLAKLNIPASSAAFIDDNPVEREEVRRAFPELWVLGDDLDRVREILLTSPRFDALELSGEARERTTTTRARLMRDDAARTATDRGAFLKSLEVRCTVTREPNAARAGRIAELLRRTTQLNTTHLVLDAGELAARLSSGELDVFTLEVSDRFAAYGLVGVALVERSRLLVFAVSCRVIGLEVEWVLLRRVMQHVLERARRAGNATATLVVPFVPSDRNAPATRLFTLPGFEKAEDGSGYRFVLAPDRLPPSPEHCTVVGETDEG